jgi:hypothetical protein
LGWYSCAEKCLLPLTFELETRYLLG